MAKFNENYLNVKQSYLFSEIAKRVSAFEQANPDKPVIRLGIGDVTLPLSKSVIESLHSAVDETLVSFPALLSEFSPELLPSVWLPVLSSAFTFAASVSSLPATHSSASAFESFLYQTTFTSLRFVTPAGI